MVQRLCQRSINAMTPAWKKGQLSGWNVTPVAGNWGVGLSRRLRIGCVFWSRKGTFCRVLHTQVSEVIDFAVPRVTLKICWAFAPVGVRLPLSAPAFQMTFPRVSERCILSQP